MGKTSSTVEKGDAFEIKALKIISEMINNYELGLIPAQCRVFGKKGYHSSKRNKEIVFDISIEVWPPEASSFALLYLVECKDYSNPVSVERIESFSKKIEQISDHNTKGVFITTNVLQESAASLCRSEGIMVIHCKGEMVYDVVFHLVRSKEIRDRYIGRQIIPTDGLVVPEIREHVIGVWTSEIESRLIRATNNLVPRSDKIHSSRPILSREQIEELSLHVLNQYRRTRVLEEQHIDIASFISFLEDLFQIKIKVIPIREFDRLGNPIIAKCDFYTEEIILDISLQNTDKFLFHLCHELGHFLLHKNLDIEQDQYEVMSDSVIEQRNRKGDLQTEREWLEWQANEFAVNMVLPKDALSIKMSFILFGMGRRLDRRFYLDDQEVNKREFGQLVDVLAKHFLVSKTVVNNRLDQFEYVIRVVSKSGPRQIGDILKNP